VTTYGRGRVPLPRPPKLLTERPIVTDLNWDAEDLDFGTETPESKVDAETDATDYDQPQEPPADIPGYDAVFSAPDFKDIVGKNQTAKSRAYERKVLSMEKAVVIGSLKRQNFADAAAVLKDGPAFARAMGDSAAKNDKIAGWVDMITAPDNPTVVLAITALGLFGQLMRNHQDEIEKTTQAVKTSWRERRQARKSGVKLVDREPVATTTVKLPFRKKPLTLKWRFRVPVLGAFTKGIFGASIAPEVLTHTVFSDPDLQRALEKQGIVIGVREPNNGE
jgi:hypothetical protein